ncbi:MAG: hypothetical protein NC200_02665 [Candidatus Gastranaerophilales bacterium]|nr:hypothetical protein [Candidatus Gastranaerophilales bacterium]
MHQITIKDIYDNYNTIIPNLDDLTSAEWYQYIKNYADDFIQLHYRDMTLSYALQWNNIEKSYEFLMKFTTIFLRSRVYTLEKLYETTQLEYNPLWNVDGIEITERNYKSDNANTINRTVINNENSTETRDLKNSDTSTNKVVDTNTTTDNLTEKNIITADETNTTSVTSETSATLYLQEQVVTDKSESDTKTNTGTRKVDSTEDTTYSDNTTETGTLDVDRKTNETSDVNDNRIINDSEKITYTRTGNIGVTKSTDLIDSQRETVKFDYLEEVCHMLISTICTLVD